jgi:uncharacterized protein (DUF952 family)
MGERVYKIVRKEEWAEAERSGIFTGSPDDKRDGFIHLSSAAQVRATCDVHFAGEHGLLLVAVDAGKLGPSLKWELSRKGQKFPHLYGPLNLSDTGSVSPIKNGADGRPIFPSEIP